MITGFRWDPRRKHRVGLSRGGRTTTDGAYLTLFDLILSYLVLSDPILSYGTDGIHPRTNLPAEGKGYICVCHSNDTKEEAPQRKPCLAGYTKSAASSFPRRGGWPQQWQHIGRHPRSTPARCP